MLSNQASPLISTACRLRCSHCGLVFAFVNLLGFVFFRGLALAYVNLLDFVFFRFISYETRRGPGQGDTKIEALEDAYGSLSQMV